MSTYDKTQFIKLCNDATKMMNDIWDVMGNYDNEEEGMTAFCEQMNDDERDAFENVVELAHIMQEINSEDFDI